ncbi:MAG: serine/threonine-protein kinase [Elusimicrobiota bacterium]
MDDPGLDRTLHQPEAEQTESKEMSIPSGVEQDPAAPRIPGYVLTQTLGRGAFAEVWKAWQSRTRKWVAVKVFTQRRGVNWVFLQREVERLIRLDKHPHIVSLLDADLDADPAYYVTDLMEGGSLERFVEKGEPATIETAARWMREIADALAYVHSKGLIHCDLKPANVLLDEQGHVRVADFGQSRVVTESAGALGTLFYMAPEQARTEEESEKLHPDVRWDIYALGATMSAVMTGRTPRGSARDELEKTPSLKERLKVYRRVIEEQPALDCGGADEDLSAIVARCASFSPESRYATIAEVGEDLEARSRTRPVSPLAGDPVYRLKRFLQRNTAITVLSCAAFAALAWAGARIVRQNARISRELAYAYLLRGRSASDGGDAASAAVYFAKSYSLDPADFRGAAVNAKACMRSLLKSERVLMHAGPVEYAEMSRDGSRIVSAGEEEYNVWDAATGARLSPPKEAGWARKVAYLGSGTSRKVVLSPDGTRFASLEETEDLVLGDTATGQPVAALTGWTAAFSPDSRTLAVGMFRGDIRFYDAATGAPKGAALKHPGDGEGVGRPVGVEFSSDGGRLLSYGVGNFCIWDVRTGKKLLGPVGYQSNSLFIAALTPQSALFSPDGRLVLATMMREARLFDAKTGAPVGGPMVHEDEITDAVFSRDGMNIATASEDRTARLWYGRALPATGYTRYGAKTEPGTPDGAPFRHEGPVYTVRFSADGRRLLTASQDKTARLWTIDKRGRECRTMPHAGAVASAVFGPGGAVVTASRDKAVRVWRLAEEAPAGESWRFYSGNDMRFSPDRSFLASMGHTGKLEVFDLRAGTATLVQSPDPGSYVHRLDFSGDSRRFWVVGDETGNTLRFWDASTGKESGRPIEAPSKIRDADLSRDGRFVLMASDSEGVRLLSAQDGSLLGDWTPADDYVSEVQFSPDGKTAALRRLYDLELMDVATGKPIGEPVGMEEQEDFRAFSPDSARYVTLSGKRHNARLFEVGKSTPVKADMGHEARVTDLLFSPDGAMLASASEDGTAQLWDGRTGRAFGPRLRHPKPVSAAAFSPDGKFLATACGDGSVRLWDAASGELFGELPIGGPLYVLQFSQDGRSLAVAGSWELFRRDVSWLYEAPPPGELLSSAEAAAQRRINAQGVLEPVPVSELR